MTELLSVDVWSDVVCPFCYLGSRQLMVALERFEHREAVVIRHRAFELDARAALSYDLTLAQLVARKYQMPVERAHALHERLEADARSLGMEWSIEQARPTNTFDAHRLIAAASAQGLGHQANERLFRAYFCEGALLSDHGTLNQLADEVGVRDVERLWDGHDYCADVRADEEEALELGITGVPSLLVDGKFMVVGAQGAEQILSVLERSWQRRAGSVA